MDDLDDALGKTSCGKGRHEPFGGRRGLRGRFDDDRVSGEDGRDEGVDDGQVREAIKYGD